jgi:hypothetical protein
MIQQLLLAVLFLSAIAYLIWVVYKTFQSKSGCSTGCAKCGAIDFAKIERQIREKKL